MRALLSAAVAVCLVATCAVPADAVESTDYVPPVDAPVVDEFRPPATRYGSGNRGLEYGTRPGQTVRSAAVGTVAFAGNVGGRLVVTVRHPDGLRTTYTGLASISVDVGRSVDAETPLGTATTSLHFGVRVGQAYLDPAELLGGRRRVFLIADEIDRRITREYAAFRFGDRGNIFTDGLDAVAGALGRGGRAAIDGLGELDDAWGELVDLVERLAWEIDPQLGYLVSIAREWNMVAVAQRAVEVWRELRRECTPSSTAPPAPPAERRILVVVGGLRSRHDDGLLVDLAPGSLGYDDGDVVRFSYEGGATPGTGAGLGIDESAYAPTDTEVGLEESAELLDELLADVRAASPGVPIDIVAHSMGGILVRLAVDEVGSGVERVVTLATPHRGAGGATAIRASNGNTVGEVAAWGVDTVDDRTGDRLPELRSDALADLSEGSDVMLDLPDIPDDVALTSVGARIDPLVPNTAARVDGPARWTVVGGTHGGLPGSAAGRRETALALGGLPPTCRSAIRAFGDAAFGEGLSLVTDGVGLGATTWAGRFDIGPRRPPTRTIQVPD
ncbi:MAG: peptidoglycan DD-metalloendopeptidase family protein [Actinomycetota bacterium]